MTDTHRTHRPLFAVVLALLVAGGLTGCYTQLATVHDPYMAGYENERRGEEAPRDEAYREGEAQDEVRTERRRGNEKRYDDRAYRYDRWRGCYTCGQYGYGSLYHDLWLWDSPWFRPGGFYGSNYAWSRWYRDPWYRYHRHDRPFWGHRPYRYKPGWSFSLSFGFGSGYGWGYRPYDYYGYHPYYGGRYGGWGGYGGYYPYYGSRWYTYRDGDDSRMNYEPRGSAVGRSGDVRGPRRYTDDPDAGYGRSVGYRGSGSSGGGGASGTYRSSDAGKSSARSGGDRVYSSDSREGTSSSGSSVGRSSSSRGSRAESSDRGSRSSGTVERSRSRSSSSGSRVRSRGSSSRSSGSVGRSRSRSSGGRSTGRSSGGGSSRDSSGGSSSSRGR